MILPNEPLLTGFNPYIERDPQDFEVSPPFIRRLFASIQAAPPTIPLVDISHWNYPVNFAELRASGMRGVILKCSESITIKDPRFEEYWRAALAEDFGVAVYHFFRDKDGAAEFNWFMSCADDFLSAVNGKTAVALDVETDNGVTPGIRASRAFQFCGLAKTAGLLDGIYSSPAKVASLFPVGETRWDNLAFQWVANWTSAATYALPAGWSPEKIKFWQRGIYPIHSWIPPVQGDGTIDYNLGYFADEAELKEWLGQALPPLPKYIAVPKGAVIRSITGDVIVGVIPAGHPVAVTGEYQDNGYLVEGNYWVLKTQIVEVE